MKTRRFQGFRVHVDRPKGFVQRGKDSSGRPWERTYKLDYGYLPRTDGGDGEGLDVFLGPDESAEDAYWVTQHKDNGRFDEWKVMLGFPGLAAALAAYDAHIPRKYRGRVVRVPVAMMQSLLGIEPDVKVAMLGSFFDELTHILGVA